MKLNSNYSKYLDVIKNLYLISFPKIERKPINLILEKCSDGSMEINIIQNLMH